MNRDVLNAYLLHQMPEEERTAFCERWETEPSILEELQMAEADLLDAYVRDSVSPRERSLIEEHLLSSEAQLQKLAFAEALHASLPRSGPVRSGAGFGVRSNRSGRISSKWVSVMMGAAAAVTVLAVGGTLWFNQNNQALRREIAVLRQTTRTEPAASQPPAPLPDSTFFTASLVADDVRGASNVLHIELPDRAEVLRLELQLEPGDEHDRYRATLSTAGRTVWSEDPVVPAQRDRLVVAYVWVPKDLLAGGTYSLTLAGSRGGRTASYRFAVGR